MKYNERMKPEFWDNFAGEKEILHSLVRKQVMYTKQEQVMALQAYDTLAPYRSKDPAVDEILSLFDKTFATLPDIGENNE